MSEWLRFTVAVLAIWRITHLIVREDGPWNVIAQARRRAGAGFLGKLMDCFYCVSLWVSAGVALVLQPSGRDSVLVWLGLSGAACLLDRMGGEPIMVERLNDMQGGTEDGMLRTESGDGAYRGEHARADVDTSAREESSGG